MLIRILLDLFLLSRDADSDLNDRGCSRLKGITFAFVAFLFSCQRTGLAERAARLPDPLVRVKRNVFNVLRRERIPSDPDTCTAFGAAGAEKIGLLNCLGPQLQGPRILGRCMRCCQPRVNLRSISSRRET